MDAYVTPPSRRSNRRPRHTVLGLSLVINALLAVSFITAAAQDGPAVNTAAAVEAGAPASPSAQKTRSRRADEATNEAAADPAKIDSPVGSDSQESTNTAPTPAAKSGDRLSTLRSQIEDAKSEAERARLRRTLVDYLVALNKKSEALSELRAMSREERLDPIGFYNIGNALARLGDTDTAIDAYRKAIKQRHGNYARALNNLGVMLFRQGRWDEAQDSFLSALRLENFRYGEASYNLGRVHNALGEADLAIREWRRTLLVQPDHSDAAIALARAYAEDGSMERGLAVLDTFMERRGPSAELTQARREILYNGDGARGAAPSVVPSAASARVSPDRASTTPLQGRDNAAGNSRPAQTKSEGGKSAGQAASAAARLRPLAVDAETYDLLERARSAREGGRNEDAASLYRRVLARSNGFFPPANLELGFVLTSLKRYDEAAATLSELTKREGARYPIAYYHLGRQYEVLGRLDLAAGAFEKAAAAYGDANPQFLLDLSRVREKEGNAQAALAAMEDYVRISRGLGRAPEWSDERLTKLRQKAEASPKQSPPDKQ